MKTWDEFYDGVRPQIPGAEPEILDEKIRSATIEFCDDTHIYQEFVTPVNIVANTATYSVTPATSGTDVVGVRKAWANGLPLDPVTEDVLEGLYTYWPDVTADAPNRFLQANPSSITLFPNPTTSVTSGLKMKIAIKPAVDATSVTDWIFENFYYAIVCGAKAMLMEMGGKPWTAPDYAKQYRAQFEAEKANAKILVSRSFTRTPPRVRMSRVW